MARVTPLFLLLDLFNDLFGMDYSFSHFDDYYVVFRTCQ